MTQEEQESIEWKEVSSGNVDEWWKPEATGDVLQGVLIQKHESDNGSFAIIDTVEGHNGTPSHTVLENLLAKVSIGSLLKITFTGMSKNKKGQEMYTYKVEVGRAA